MKTFSLSPEQLQHLQQLVNQLCPMQKITEVKVKFHQKGKATLFVCATLKNVDRGMRLEDILHPQGYQELVLKTEKGKIVHVQLIDKQRIST